MLLTAYFGWRLYGSLRYLSHWQVYGMQATKDSNESIFKRHWQQKLATFREKNLAHHRKIVYGPTSKLTFI